eukprot:1754207-Alexandrium_andersonii.AAC.1
MDNAYTEDIEGFRAPGEPGGPEQSEGSDAPGARRGDPSFGVTSLGRSRPQNWPRRPALKRSSS